MIILRLPNTDCCIDAPGGSGGGIAARHSISGASAAAQHSGASLLALCVGRRRPLSYALGITFLRLVAEVRPATTALSPVKMAPDLTHTTTKNAHGNQLKNDSCPIQKLESLFNHFH